MSAPEQQLDRYLRHVTIERGLSSNTQAAYRRDLSAYLEWLSAESIDDLAQVSVPVVTNYMSSLATRKESPLTSTSLSRTLSSIRGFHRFLVEEGELTEDITTDVRRPKLPKALPKALTIDQVVALLGAVSGDDPVAIRDRAFLEFMYATGARVSEATALNVDDVTAIDDSVRVRGKGSKQRIVPLGSYAKSALDEYLVRVRPLFSAEGRSTPALFLGPRGGRLSRQSAWLIITAAAEKAHLTAHVSPHTLRHSFATHLLAGGADVRVVQELLGHASVATTQIYTQVTADTLRESYRTSHPRAVHKNQ
ncbi:MAG: site-specific tyrosine recombinase XerD [Actinomycetota bacterium]